MNDSRALKIRVLKYLIPVTIICIVFNITKFFEITVVYIPIQKNATLINAGTNVSSISTMTTLMNDSFGVTESPTDELMFPMENITLPATLADMTTVYEAITSAQEAEVEENIQYRVALNITEFRTDPMYSINFNWFRFIAIGVIPFLLLVYFNTQIYLDIRKQRRRKRAARYKLPVSFPFLLFPVGSFIKFVLL